MNEPIGIFDSGIGGLTVVREIVRELPGESLVFIGDTARVPYGSRGNEVIAGFAAELSEFLIARRVKYLVAACNTISSTCLDAIADRAPVPVLGVLEPAVREAVERTQTGRVGVIGTRATIGGKRYEDHLRQLRPDIEVFAQACPLFVPLAEEGMLDGDATRLIAESYLTALRDKRIDVLILACTHYPLLRNVIQEVIGSEVLLVDSARPTAAVLASGLAENGLSTQEGGSPSYELLVTDAPERVQQVAALFFGDALPGRLRKTSLGDVHRT